MNRLSLTLEILGGTVAAIVLVIGCFAALDWRRWRKARKRPQPGLQLPQEGPPPFC